MARTPLFDLLRRAARLSSSARRRGEPSLEHAERLREEHARARLGRRELLRAAGGTAALAAFPVVLSGCDGGGGPRVGVVGAGLAGLHCAYRLQRAGVDVTVFEAWNRIGGRTFTARGMLAGDQLAELGGELVDSNHATMQELADELGLTLDDLAEPAGIRADTFHFGGSVLTEDAIITSFETVAPALEAAFTAAETDDAEYERLDNLSIPEFLDSIAGADDLIKQILDVAYTGEYGLEADEQSILNVVYLIDAETTDPFRIFGDSDERYHIHEGSQAVADGLADRLGDRIHLDHRLVAIRSASDGRVVLSFELPGGGSHEETFDHVVLTLPFTQLRTVEIEEGLIAQDKAEIIAELGYGQNAKLMMQLESRPWREAMAGGAGFTDNGAQTFWDSARGQAGAQGILTHFAGGDGGLALGTGTAADQAARILPLMDAIFPGTQAAFNGMALRMHWPTAPYHGGSYACYRPGQWAYYGVEGRREGRLHFAGEHTSLEFQGYMEGAAESGALVAMDILADLGLMMGAPLLRAPRRRRARVALAAR